MGKSNKKIKNDRINAIRKQYDAFLEEDKKRRERNEYILGKLDKMRSSTALVPTSTKGGYQLEPTSSEIFMRTNNLKPKIETRDNYLSHLERHTINSGILNKPMDNLHILKEISKKYILIPKRITPIENDFIYNNGNDIIEEDWRSKYNILEDLKKIEKEDQSNPNNNHYNDSNMQNNKLNLNVDSNVYDMQPSKLGKDSNTFDVAIIPEKNNELTTVIESKSSTEKQAITNTQVHVNVSENIDHDNEESKLLPQISSISLNESVKLESTQFVNDNIEDNIKLQEETNLEHEKYNSEHNDKDMNLINNISSSQIGDISNINQPKLCQKNIITPAEYNAPMADTNIYTAFENSNADVGNKLTYEHTISDVPPQECDAVEHTTETLVHDQNIDKQKATTDSYDVTSTERVELYREGDNNSQEQIVAQETTYDKPLHYDPVQDVVPVDVENIQHPSHAEQESEINAFEAEQKEMFYSEQSHTDYAYGHDEGNPGEYPGGYEQNEQYSYYEGVQQEQPYATNINEHEESTERYDPHYNEQYEGSYENQQPDNVNYEDTNAYAQQQYVNESPQFENIANYENQQEHVNNENDLQENVLLTQENEMYDQHLYAEHPDAREQIEQQLINEEGYIESSPVNVDDLQKQNEGETEILTNITTHEEAVPDPKLV